MNIKNKKEMTTTGYQKLTQLEHILKRPDTYIGAIRPKDFETRILTEEGLIEKKNLSLPEGVKRLFLEIISNSGDNVDTSRKKGIEPGTIEVDIENNETITITNGGSHIPVKKIVFDKEGERGMATEVKDDEEGYWLPHFIFGMLLTSNNYDDDARGSHAGRNGYGAKLVNIFSKNFKVVVEDPETKKRFTGIWKDNMFNLDESQKPDIEVVKDKEIKKGKVSITWTLDFERFGMKCYSEDDVNLFRRFTADYSFTCKILTVFNKKEYDFRSITDYSKLNFSEEKLKNSFFFFTWNDITPETIRKGLLKTQEKKIVEAKKFSHIPEMEIMVIDTPDQSEIISFVNGLETVDGGVHVDASQEQVFRHVIGIINGEKKKGKRKTFAISTKNIRPHLSFVINAKLENTEYTSQSKTKLAYPSIKNVNYDDKILKSLNNWELINRLYAEADAIASSKASKGDGNKRKHISLPKGEDANFAGTNKSKQCVLFVTEGDSASNYSRKRICELPGGKDFYGDIPLGGKPLNVTRARPLQYAENRVISSLKQMLGLKEGLDYTKEENLKTLRYGFVVLCTDADVDGMHILAHVLNLFREKFPGILKKNMVAYLRTPIIKVLKGDKIMKRFFYEKDFEKWKGKNSTKGLVVRYYKGLGTSNDNDVSDDAKNANTVICFYDSKTDENLDLAFHADNSDSRKNWIEKWRDVTHTDDILSVDINSIKKSDDKLIKGQDISHFINRQLIEYSVASLMRTIPKEHDGLKDGQRKIVWTALNLWNYSSSGKSMKVSRFASKTADLTQYHHGEKSLSDTIIKLAQDFVGSNNMGLFRKDGQFGTRSCGGENAADPRYSEIRLNWWVPYVFYKESVELVEKQIIDDEECEPYWLPSVIPLGVVNGMLGIATAFSTCSPSYNPLEIIKWIKNRCEDKKNKPLSPWYNGFRGRMKIVNRDEKFNAESEMLPGDIDADNPLQSPTKISDLSEDELERIDEDSLAIMKSANGAKLTLKTFGTFEVDSNVKNDDKVKIKVTELPVKSWIHKYRKWLELLVQNKHIFDFKDNSTTENPHFEIHWNKNWRNPTYQSLRLVRSMGISNITLIDNKGFPKQFTTIDEVLETYFNHMISHYKDVRSHRIEVEEKKVKDISFKMKFVIHVLKKDIIIMKEKEENIKEKMKEYEIPFDYYEKCKAKDFSQESVEKWQNQLKETKLRLAEAEKLTAEGIWKEKLDILEKELRKRYSKGYLNMAK